MLHQRFKERRPCRLDLQIFLRYLNCLFIVIMKLGLKHEVKIFDFFSFDRGHNTTRHNYSCYVDGNHNANDNGTDFNDRTDNNNNDKFTWVSSYIGILWHIQLDTWTFKPNVQNIRQQKFGRTAKNLRHWKVMWQKWIIEWSRISKSVFPAQRYYRLYFFHCQARKTSK